MGYAFFVRKGRAGTDRGSHSVRAPAAPSAGVSVRAFQHGITSLLKKENREACCGFPVWNEQKLIRLDHEADRQFR
jgi:hypothetical protein